MIRVRGAREHNLQGLDLDLPTGALIVLTGVSGSGKSSLAFDTLHVEGRRRFVETLSSALREAMDRQGRPAVDSLQGLPPTVGLPQRRAGTVGPRATVASLTDLHDLLAVLYAREGTQHCPGCGRAIRAMAPERMSAELAAAGERITLLAPIFSARVGALKPVMDEILAQGFARVRVDGAMHRIEELPPVDARLPHTVEVVVDRVKSEQRERLHDGVRLALKAGGGRLRALIDEGRVLAFGEKPWCEYCDRVEPLADRAALMRGDPVAAHVEIGGITLAAREAQPLSTFAAPPTELEAVAREIGRRSQLLRRLGLGHLSLDRPASTLSAGELQRVRLAAAAGSELSGLLYVLDEPGAGLHPAEVPGLVELLRELKALGNTVLVVEHDPAVVAAADLEIELGPGAGPEGGRLLYHGPPRPLPEPDLPRPRRNTKDGLLLRGASGRNLAEVDLRVPRGAVTAVTGRGGAGKSTLVLDTLHAALIGGAPLPFRALEGAPELTVAMTGASPSGARSSLATFLGIWDEVRSLLAATSEAQVRGLGPGAFSLAQKGGRCEACKGEGRARVEMGFLPDMWVICEVCGGRRFDRAALAVRWKGLDPSEILDLPLREARRHFAGHPRLDKLLRAPDELGLGHLAMGRSTASLSGGEAWRLRCARDLSTGEAARTLYILDEPSVGLHPRDVAAVATLLHRLADDGASVLMIEHDPLLISSADLELRLDEGRVIYEGAPA